MEKKNNDEYKGFNKDLAKEDLNKEELGCYNKLMDGIDKASYEEKDDIAHLMEVVIESEEKEHTHCARCKAEFTDDYNDINNENKRIYCNDCIGKMWSSEAAPKDTK